jgi:hypothetical protein
LIGSVTGPAPDAGARFPEELPGRTGKELLRVVQEALTNARRHSGASRVRVRQLAERSDLPKGCNPKLPTRTQQLTLQQQAAKGPEPRRTLTQC